MMMMMKIISMLMIWRYDHESENICGWWWAGLFHLQFNSSPLQSVDNELQSFWSNFPLIPQFILRIAQMFSLWFLPNLSWVLRICLMNWIAVLSSDNSCWAKMKVVVMIFLKGAHPSVVIVTMVYQKDAGMDSKVLPSTFWKKTMMRASSSSSSLKSPFHNRTW